MNDMASAVPKKDKVKRSMLYQTGKKLRPLLNRFLSKHSLVGDPPVFDKAAFPWTAELERHWPVIRAELDALLRQGTAIPALRDISPITGALPKAAGARSSSGATATGSTKVAVAARAPPKRWRWCPASTARSSPSSSPAPTSPGIPG